MEEDGPWAPPPPGMMPQDLDEEELRFWMEREREMMRRREEEGQVREEDLTDMG